MVIDGKPQGTTAIDGKPQDTTAVDGKPQLLHACETAHGRFRAVRVASGDVLIERATADALGGDSWRPVDATQWPVVVYSALVSTADALAAARAAAPSPPQYAREFQLLGEGFSRAREFSLLGRQFVDPVRVRVSRDVAHTPEVADWLRALVARSRAEVTIVVLP